MRASDADREKTGELLREHHAVGRLTADEFSERLDQVYAAKTLGELDALLADLPAIDLYQPPSASIRPVARRPSRRREGPGANLDRSAGNGLARLGPGRIGWAGATAVAVLAWVGLAVASGGAAAWLVWFLVIVIPVAVAAAVSGRRSRPLSRESRRRGAPGAARLLMTAGIRYRRWSRTGQVQSLLTDPHAARTPCAGGSPRGIRRMVWVLCRRFAFAGWLQ